MKTSVLITGASGFVGRSIIDSLAKDEDYALYALVRDIDKERRLSDKGIHICKGDITNPDSLRNALEGKDVIIHCAALMSNFDAEGRKRFYDVNVLGTENLLNLCDLKSLKQFIHISTVGVYGVTGKKPVSENEPYGRYLSIYEWSKKESELVVLRYANNRNLPFTILRPSQLYGSGMRYGWPQTIGSIKSGSMLVPGNGMSRIHLLNINDFVKAIRLVICNTSAINKIYNIAGLEALNLEDVFDIISNILEVRPPLHVPYIVVYFASILLCLIPYELKNAKIRLLTPHRVRFFATDHIYDISRAMNELGYMPSVSLKDGFREMIAWCEKEGII